MNIEEKIKFFENAIEILTKLNTDNAGNSDFISGINKATLAAITELEHWKEELKKSPSLQSQIINKIDENANLVISKFAASQDKNKQFDEIKTAFFSSEDYKNFRSSTIKQASDDMKKGLLTKEIFDHILSSFNITLSQDEMNEIVNAETRPPKPTTVLDNGSQYVWDAETKTWTIVKK